MKNSVCILAGIVLFLLGGVIVPRFFALLASKKKSTNPDDDLFLYRLGPDVDTTLEMAVAESNERARIHRKEANWTIGILVITIFTYVGVGLFILGYESQSQSAYGTSTTVTLPRTHASASKQVNSTRSVGNKGSKTLTNELNAAYQELNAQSGGNAVLDRLALGASAIFVVVVSIGWSIYRVHLQEIVKAENTALGFRRIQIAASGSSEGYGTDVRMALTNEAFVIDPPRFAVTSVGKKSKVEGMLPGHPASDLSAMVLDRLLEAIAKLTDVVRKTTGAEKGSGE